MEAFEHMTESELANYIKSVDSGMKRRSPDAVLIDSGMTVLGGEKALRIEHLYTYEKLILEFTYMPRLLLQYRRHCRIHYYKHTGLRWMPQ